MRFESLAEWLSWQESLNPKSIDLGLERVRRVLRRMGRSDRFDCPLITVAGTNGKGSVVAYIEAIARAAGRQVCAYTSPHLLRYNERIRINGDEIDDLSLIDAFERIDQARGDEALTYFEFGTLAAIELFTASAPDLVIMEIGLGGRLDAVNLMQPDVAVITTIAIDHTDWLGADRESIGFEKAGVMRAGKPAICGDHNPPDTLMKTAADLQARLKVIGRDFRIERGRSQWRLIDVDRTLDQLPIPALAGDFQVENAATAIVALSALRSEQADVGAIKQGLIDARLPGRFQTVQWQPQILVDVAHNAQAATALASQLNAQSCTGRTIAVLAMLADKPVADVVASLSGAIDQWFIAGLAGVARGLSANQLVALVEPQLSDVKLQVAATVAEACAQALATASDNDRIIVFGSFYTVAAAMQFFTEQR